MSGLMIAVEGIDGSGKTSFIDRISTELSLSGYKTLILSEYSFTPIKQIINNLLKEQNELSYNVYAHLYLSLSEYIILEPKVKNCLRENYIIFFDRYIYSSIAYSAALGVDFSWLQDLKNQFKRPDLVILCEQSPENAWNHKKQKVENIEVGFSTNSVHTVKENFISFQSSVANYYNKIDYSEMIHWKRINCYCNESFNKVFQFLIKIISVKIKKNNKSKIN